MYDVKYNEGKAQRKNLSRKDQEQFTLPKKRPSILQMINASNYDRLPDLVPIRHYRMSASPFAFYRGTASIMAHDLSYLPKTGIHVQAIGDCHLMNFGGYATPERSIVFDVNDFDETHPAPWEWDVKRLATSFVLAARNLTLDEGKAKESAYIFVQSYRSHVLEYSEMKLLDLWYMKFDVAQIRSFTKNNRVKNILDAAVAKAQKSTQDKVFYKITQSALGGFEIAEDRPLVYHPYNIDEVREMVNLFMNNYRQTLTNDKQLLLDQFKIVDVALKVVGVGSVGTRCYVVLLLNEHEEPLFLQVKEARQSVLEPYTAKSSYAHQGQRVVEGQRLVQAASDIFLGWSTGPAGRFFYLRQLRDRKIAPQIELFDDELLFAYARLCGRMLARAHVKTSNAPLLAGYMGKSDTVEMAISKFALSYADQTERDYEIFVKAIKTGKLPVQEEKGKE